MLSAVVAALTLALAFTLGAAAPARAQDGVESYATNVEVVIGVGKSQVLELPRNYTDIMVADPKIADVLPLNGHSVYVVGKTIGSTAITVYGPNKRLLAAVSVVISADIDGFKTRLHEILPDERDIAARAASDSIVLSGTVSSGAALQQIMELANTYSPGKVVNMMSVEGSQQVMLSVRFVEMERTTANNIRLNLRTTNNTGRFTMNTGDTVLAAVANSFGVASTVFRVGNGDLTVLLDALETKGLVKTLAEPNLTTMSGEAASFLAGGEFPIPVAEGSGTTSAPAGPGGQAITVAPITIEFKQFGIGLGFTPTILKDGLINMVVNPEVSTLDPTNAVSSAGVIVPGLKVRRAHTTVELRDGESFTIAGLLSDNYQNNIREFPFVGEIPILGSLFRSTGFQRDQTELIIVVTPHIVTPRRGYVATPADQFVPPSDFELFLLGFQHGSAANIRPEDRVLMSEDPSQGGIDGPHGHVLY
jgi:pilus assembly protein CpaC